MAITNLSQYYGSIGQALPSVSSRAGLYSQYGLGGGYSGTASQNAALLSKLMGGSATGSAGSSALPPSATDNWSSMLDEFTKSETQKRQALEARQKAEEEGLFGQYESKIAGQEKLSDAYTRLQQEQGIPDITKQLDIFKGEIYKVKDLLDQLDENVTQRTTGTLTNEAQRNRQIAYEGQPLETSLSRLGTGMAPLSERLTAAQGQVGTLLGLTKEDQATQLKPIEARLGAMSDRFAREMTGYTNDKELQLNTLLDKIQRGRELSDREWQAAQDLASQEREFAQATKLAKMQLDTQYPTIPSSPQAPAMSSVSSVISDLGKAVRYGSNGQVWFKDPKTGELKSREETASRFKIPVSEIYKNFPGFKATTSKF